MSSVYFSCYQEATANSITLVIRGSTTTRSALLWITLFPHAGKDTGCCLYVPLVFFPHSEAFQISKGKIFRLDEVRHKRIQTMYVMHQSQCHLHHPQRFRMISTIPERQF